jgi:hypothetical protein
MPCITTPFRAACAAILAVGTAHLAQRSGSADFPRVLTLSCILPSPPSRSRNCFYTGHARDHIGHVHFSTAPVCSFLPPDAALIVPHACRFREPVLRSTSHVPPTLTNTSATAASSTMLVICKNHLRHCNIDVSARPRLDADTAGSVDRGALDRTRSAGALLFRFRGDFPSLLAQSLDACEPLTQTASSAVPFTLSCARLNGDTFCLYDHRCAPSPIHVLSVGHRSFLPTDLLL